MTWNLEENPDDPKELQIYKYVLKRSKNPEFSKTITRFLNLYEYLKTQKFKNSSELRENILSYGKPLLTEKEAEQVFEMSIMRGGESKYPFLNNVFRQFLGWVYKWQPDVLKTVTDNIVDIKERLQIFKHIREDNELGEIYGIVLDSITEIIPMNVTILENIASEMPVVGPVSGLIATMVSSVFLLFNNLLHFTQGNDGDIIVDSLLIIPFVGTSLHSAAKAVESHAGKLSDKRLKLIETIRKSFGEEEAELFASYIPDLNELESYQMPTLDGLKNNALSLVEKRGLPTSMDSIRNIAGQNLQGLAEQRGLPTSMDSIKNMAGQHLQGLAEQRGLPTSMDSIKNMAFQQAQNINSMGTALPGSQYLDRKVVGGNPLTRGRPLKKKWGTRRKLK
jgi:hypothetical protein